MKQILIGRTKTVGEEPKHPINNGYTHQGILHPIEDLEMFGVAPRVTNPLRRWGYDYVEDLLGTSPWNVTEAQGPHPFKHRWHPSWNDIPRINKVAIVRILNALASWKEMNRQQKGKTVADNSRVPI